MRRRENDHDQLGGGTPGNASVDWLTWLKGLLIERGYDVTSPRAGGQAKLVKDTGIGQATIQRLIAEGKVPAYDTLVLLSRHLAVPLEELLIRTGKAREDDFPQRGSESDQIRVSSGKPLTPEEIAALADVPEEDRDWFATMIRRMRRRGDDGDSTAGGAAAEG